MLCFAILRAPGSRYARPVPRRLLSIAIALTALAACGTPSKPARHPTSHSGKRTPAQPSARAVLTAYLDLTFAGNHGRAYGYLSPGDRARLSKGAYIDQEAANDRIRAQMRALGPVSYRISGVRERGAGATAMVAVRTGLGTDHVRFVMKRASGAWTFDYGQSWASDAP